MIINKKKVILCNQLRSSGPFLQFLKLDEDIPYIQYPSKQQQQTQSLAPPQPTPPQQQQILIDEPSTSSVVEVLAPIVVKLPGDEPLPPPQIAVPTPQPIVPRKYSTINFVVIKYFSFSSTTTTATIERSIRYLLYASRCSTW